MERSDLIKSFLQKNNLKDESFKWITGDASFRRYARIGKKGNSFILMDTPQSEKPHEFVTIDKILVNAGLSAPKIYDADLENGLILLEDLGENIYAKLLDNGYDQFQLYKVAIDALVEIAKIKNLSGVAPYDSSVIHTGAELFTDWFMPAAIGYETKKKVKDEYFNILDDLFASIKDVPNGLMLADYHINNLIFLPDRKGFQSCGLLDFQDGTVGPLAYDLMSLLEDARRDVSVDLQKECLQYYMEKTRIQDKDLFLRSYHVTALKRHLRVIGIFVRLKVRDHKENYLEHLPRVWRLLLSHIDLPYMQSFKNWLDANVPEELRTIPSSIRANK